VLKKLTFVKLKINNMAKNGSFETKWQANFLKLMLITIFFPFCLNEYI